MPRPQPHPRAPVFDRAELPIKATVYSVEHEAPGEPPLRAYYLAIIGKRQRQRPGRLGQAAESNGHYLRPQPRPLGAQGARA